VRNVTILFVVFKRYSVDSHYITMHGRTYYLRDLAHVGYVVYRAEGGGGYSASTKYLVYPHHLQNITVSPEYIIW
jgi:hypothetical protein